MNTTANNDKMTKQGLNVFDLLENAMTSIEEKLASRNMTANPIHMKNCRSKLLEFTLRQTSMDVRVIQGSTERTVTLHTLQDLLPVRDH